MTQRTKDAVAWTIGVQADVGWISDRSRSGPQITSAIPPQYDAYATLTNVGGPDLARDLDLERRQDRAFVDVLQRHAGEMAWWLGYLETGASDIVFFDAPRVTAYWDWK